MTLSSWLHDRFCCRRYCREYAAIKRESSTSTVQPTTTFLFEDMPISCKDCGRHLVGTPCPEKLILTPAKYRLLKPLPGIPVGTIYTYYSSDVLTQYEARDLPYEATQALHCLSPRTVENNPDFFEKVEDTPPYPIQTDKRGFLIPPFVSDERLVTLSGAAPLQPKQEEPKTPETDEDHLWCNTCDHHRSGHGLGINACVESPCTCKRFLSIAMIKAQTWEEGWKARAKWEDVTTCHDASDCNPYEK